MWKIRWICVALLALGMRGAALAQQPSSRLPATRGELAAEALTRAQADSLLAEGVVVGLAGDSVYAGRACAIDTLTGKWIHADTSVTVRATGIAMQTVATDALVRIKISGVLRLPGIGWNWTPGKMLYSDSLLPGGIGYGGNPDNKKQQELGEAIDSVTIVVGVGKWIHYWEDE